MNIGAYSNLWLLIGYPFVQRSLLSLHIHKISYVSPSIQLRHNGLHDFLDPKYLPTKTTSIITSGNTPSFSASYVTIFLSFMNTNNVSEYITAPVIMEAFYDQIFSTLPPTTVIRHTLHHLLHFTNPPPTHAKKSFQNSPLPNEIPTSVLSYINIMSLSHIP